MAVITINMGGRPMAVDVPDFAMEQTQQDIRNIMSDLQATLTGVQTATQQGTVGDEQIKQAIANLQANDNKLDSKEERRQSKFAEGVGKASALGMMQSVAKPGMLTSFMKSIGLGTMGVAFGMVTGLAKELSSTFSFAGDVGVSFGGDIIKTSERLSNIGLQLDQFGDVIAQNTGMMFELAGNVEDGSQRFIGLVEDFRKGSADFGYFGLASSEMAQFMAEELDIRRKSMDQEQLRLFIQNDLNDAMVKNFEEQTKMARITGENVRDRIRAQMAAKEDARLQAAMIGMTQDQRVAIDGVMSNLTENLGGAGKELMNAIIQEVAVEGTGLATAGGRMAQLDTSGNLMRIIQQGADMIRAGATPQEANNAIAQALQDFKKTADLNTFQIQAFAGNDDAMKLMQMALNINEQNNEIADKRNELMNAENTEREKYIAYMRGLNADLDVTEAKQANLALRAIMRLGGEDAKDVVGGMRKFTKQMTAALSDDFTKGLFEGLGAIMNQITVGPLLNTANGNANLSEQTFLFGKILEATGIFPDLLTKAMQAPQMGVATLYGGDAFLKEAFGDRYMKTRAVGPGGQYQEEYFDYNAFARDQGQLLINGSQEFFNKMSRIFHDPNENGN